MHRGRAALLVAVSLWTLTGAHGPAPCLGGDGLLAGTPLLDFDRLLFIRRYTFPSTHFYTDFIDGCEHYGGNLSVLDLGTGEVTDLVPEMADGIFDRFDLHFSATRIVFDWKRSPKEGFRLYEIAIDPKTGRRTGGPRQLTFPPDDEAVRIAKYGRDPDRTPGPAPYWHQTDDMHPCYLPDGGIAFTSTRCEYGTLCDAPDILATAVLHRMDGDGSHIEQLTRSPVIEFCPTLLADGRILYRPPRPAVSRPGMYLPGAVPPPAAGHAAG